MTIVLLSGDLMVVSRVAGSAAQRGLEVRTFSNAEQAIESCREQTVGTLIVDLATPSLDVAALVTALKADNSSPPTIIAFCPHVHEERLAAARDAGCDHVVSRGQFMGQLDALLQL